MEGWHPVLRDINSQLKHIQSSSIGAFYDHLVFEKKYVIEVPKGIQRFSRVHCLIVFIAQAVPCHKFFRITHESDTIDSLQIPGRKCPVVLSNVNLLASMLNCVF